MHLLQKDDIGLRRFDAVADTLEHETPITATKSFVDVIGQNPDSGHGVPVELIKRT